MASHLLFHYSNCWFRHRLCQWFAMWQIHSHLNPVKHWSSLGSLHAKKWMHKHTKISSCLLCPLCPRSCSNNTRNPWRRRRLRLRLNVLTHRNRQKCLYTRLRQIKTPEFHLSVCGNCGVTDRVTHLQPATLFCSAICSGEQDSVTWEQQCQLWLKTPSGRLKA